MIDWPHYSANMADLSNRGWHMWVAPVAISLCTWLSYVDRQTLAVLSPSILQDTHLSVQAYATAVSAFNFAYMIANPVWGSILDRIGLRIGMLVAVALWSAASASHAWVAGFIGFAVARTVLGLGEGATYPGALRSAMDSLPPDRQSRGMAVAYSGSTLGAIVTPLVVTPIFLAFGWRAAFVVTGALGALWLVLWFAVARPPWLRHTERTAKLTWPNLKERRFWMLVAGMGLGGAPLGVILTLSPLYLSRAMGMTQLQLGQVLWIPTLGWGVSYYFFGWIGDRYIGNDPRPARLYLILSALILPLALVTLTTSRAMVLALFFWGLFIGVGFITISLHVAARAYPRDRSAMVAGIGSGAWGAVLALVLLVYGPWFDRKMYGATFVTLSLIPILGTGIWLWMTANVRKPQAVEVAG